MIAHCFFEQSGTFKNEFKKLGIDAYDYDIQDEFGETDFRVDLFDEIAKSYEGGASVFDNIKPEDLVIAFFPCTRFESKVPLWFRGENWSQRGWTDRQKLETSITMHRELAKLYELICKLTIVCIDKKIRLVIENPYTQPHYLTMFWCIKPTIIDKDRTENGDFYKKQTQYFFINCEPKRNLVFEPIDYVPGRVITRTKRQENTTIQTERSMIHPQYANRFIRQYLIEEAKE